MIITLVGIIIYLLKKIEDNKIYVPYIDESGNVDFDDKLKHEMREKWKRDKP